jgi:hypothetical protein
MSPASIKKGGPAATALSRAGPRGFTTVGASSPRTPAGSEVNAIFMRSLVAAQRIRQEKGGRR